MTRHSQDSTDLMHRSVDVVRRNGAAPRADTDDVVVEEPLEIRLNGQSFAVTMRTPGQDDALAVGFMTTEGVLRSPDDLLGVANCEEKENPWLRNVVNVRVAAARVPEKLQAGRQRYASSACGLCGRATIEAVQTLAPPFDSVPAVQRNVLVALPVRLREAQRAFDRTGGLHAAGLFTRDGALVYLAEDVGRHNAVDKVIGQALMGRWWPLEGAILMVSGRAGFEIVQKAAVARVPVACAVSAPSTLAIDLARECGMVLVAFLRGESFNVYAGEEHVV